MSNTTQTTSNSSNKLGKLVLSRRPGEAIKCGDAVIVIERVQGSRVTVSIAAPRELPIFRCELLGDDA
jgi:carbon storage regulator CsrA